MAPDNALVVLSGGQDSTTALLWAKRQFHGDLYTISYDYGQRHQSELDAALEIADLVGVTSHVFFKVPPVLARTALAPDGDGAREEVSPTNGYLGLPSTFTPGRNAIFLTLAAAHAFRANAHHLVTGVCQTDFSGYPDCRRTFVDKLQDALVTGMEWPLYIHTPIMWLDKKATVELARTFGSVAAKALAISVTCYHGLNPGCGECPACIIRERGFHAAGFEDPQRAGGTWRLRATPETADRADTPSERPLPGAGLIARAGSGSVSGPARGGSGGISGNDG
jgi:7-cyano-7-deazaguanine synthase